MAPLIEMPSLGHSSCAQGLTSQKTLPGPENTEPPRAHRRWGERGLEVGWGKEETIEVLIKQDGFMLPPGFITLNCTMLFKI